MRKIGTLTIMLALLVAFSGIALAGEEFGFCSSSSHAKRVAADKTDTAKTTPTEVASKPDATKLMLAQSSKDSKTAPEVKK